MKTNTRSPRAFRHHDTKAVRIAGSPYPSRPVRSFRHNHAVRILPLLMFSVIACSVHGDEGYESWDFNGYYAKACQSWGDETAHYKVHVNVPLVPPVADPGGPYDAIAGTSVHFVGSDSLDADGRIETYTLNFGDGSSGFGETPTHTFAQQGIYVVILTITDNKGLTDSAGTTVTGEPSGTTNPAHPGLITLFHDAAGSRFIQWDGLSGRTYAIDYSPDLATWVRIGQVVATDGADSFQETDAERIANPIGHFRVQLVEN